MVNPPDQREPLEQLAEEFLTRRRAGERASVEEYAAAHPDLADEIRDLFPTMLALEKLGDDTPDGSGPAAGGAGVGRPVGGFAHPRQLGDLRLVRELGRGGMGVVYEAIQESLGRRVAVKVLPTGSLNNPRMLERFRREARTAASLQHPHIVPVFGVGVASAPGGSIEGGQQDDLHYLIMQIVDGVGL
ncbi:MAG: protein kinase, partial [Planctomycetota bacterium]